MRGRAGSICGASVRFGWADVFIKRSDGQYATENENAGFLKRPANSGMRVQNLCSVPDFVIDYKKWIFPVREWIYIYWMKNGGNKGQRKLFGMIDILWVGTADMLYSWISSSLMPDSKTPSLIASLKDPNQCAARRYCKVKQCEAAVQKQFGMNIYAVSLWHRTSSAPNYIQLPTHLFKVFAKLFSKSVPSPLPNNLDY